MKLLLLTLLIVNISSCAKKKSKFFEAPKESFSQYINQKEMNKVPNLTKDVYIKNDDYPIELAIYQDGQFYYNLPNLGDGRGTWEYKNGGIKLFSKRTLFDMHIWLRASEQNAESLKIEFTDRFGQKSLDATKIAN